MGASAGQSWECVALTFKSGNKKKKKTRPLWLGCHQVSGPQAKVRNVWHRLSKVAGLTSLLGLQVINECCQLTFKSDNQKRQQNNKITLPRLASSVMFAGQSQ